MKKWIIRNLIRVTRTRAKLLHYRALLEQFYVPKITECCTANKCDKIFWHGDRNAVRNAGVLFKLRLLIVQEDTLFTTKGILCTDSAPFWLWHIVDPFVGTSVAFIFSVSVTFVLAYQSTRCQNSEDRDLYEPLCEKRKCIKNLQCSLRLDF
jgi:hypothetical protein